MHLVVLLFSLLAGTHAIPSGDAHDFHLSKCLIEYNSRESAIQISLHLFIDDTEEALRRRGFDRLYICTEKEDELAEQYLKDYLLQHLRLELDGTPLRPSFLGKEVTDDLMGMWCYLEITEVRAGKELIVTNQLLLDTFDDQKNLVNVIGPGNQKAVYLFAKGEVSERINWQP